MYNISMTIKIELVAFTQNGCTVTFNRFPDTVWYDMPGSATQGRSRRIILPGVFSLEKMEEVLQGFVFKSTKHDLDLDSPYYHYRTRHMRRAQTKEGCGFIYPQPMKTYSPLNEVLTEVILT